MSKTCIKLSTGEEFSSLEEAVNSQLFRSGDTITFLTDATLGQPVVIEKRCSMDLGGNILFIPMSGGLTFKGGVSVDIYNGKIQTLAPEQIEDAIIIQGSKTKVTFDHDLGIETRGTAVHVRRRGSAILNDVSIKSSGDQPTVYVDDLASVFTVQGGEIVSLEASAVSIRDGGSMVVNDLTSKIHTEADGLAPDVAFPAIVVDGQDSYLQFNDGSIFSSKTPAIRASASASVEINGGEISTDSNDYTTLEVKENSTKLEIKGGFVHSSKTSVILSDDMCAGDAHIVSITGGRVGIKDETKELVVTVGKGDQGVSFSGGSVKGYLDPKFLASGYALSDTPDEFGYYQIVESDGTSSYSSSVDASFVGPLVEPPMFPEDVDLTSDLPSESEGSDTSANSDSNNVNVLDFLNSKNQIDLAPVPEDFKPIDSTNSESENSSNEGNSQSSDPINNIVILDTSVVIKNKIYIYRIPSRKSIMTEWQGVLRLIDRGYIGLDLDEYVRVSFRIPGSGKIAIGFVLSSDLTIL